MENEKTTQQDLNIQRLELGLNNHIVQCDAEQIEVKKFLKSIDSKLESIKESLSHTTTKIAVLENEYRNHLKQHEQSSKDLKWQIGIAMTILTIGINVITFTVKHLISR